MGDFTIGSKKFSEETIKALESKNKEVIWSKTNKRVVQLKEGAGWLDVCKKTIFHPTRVSGDTARKEFVKFGMEEIKKLISGNDVSEISQAVKIFKIISTVQQTIGKTSESLNNLQLELADFFIKNSSQILENKIPKDALKILKENLDNFAVPPKQKNTIQSSIILSEKFQEMMQLENKKADPSEVLSKFKELCDSAIQFSGNIGKERTENFLNDAFIAISSRFDKVTLSDPDALKALQEFKEIKSMIKDENLTINTPKEITSFVYRITQEHNNLKLTLDKSIESKNGLEEELEALSSPGIDSVISMLKKQNEVDNYMIVFNAVRGLHQDKRMEKLCSNEQLTPIEVVAENFSVEDFKKNLLEFTKKMQRVDVNYRQENTNELFLAHIPDALKDKVSAEFIKVNEKDPSNAELVDLVLNEVCNGVAVIQMAATLGPQITDEEVLTAAIQKHEEAKGVGSRFTDVVGSLLGAEAKKTVAKEIKSPDEVKRDREIEALTMLKEQFLPAYNAEKGGLLDEKEQMEANIKLQQELYDEQKPYFS